MTVITEQLAMKIADEFMDTMNPDRWNGYKAEMPSSVNTATYEDTNVIKIKNIECHIEIVIKMADNKKPVLYVDLVTNSDQQSIAMCHTETLSSSHIISLMIQHVCKNALAEAA